MLELKNLQVTRAAAVLVGWARANIIFKRFVMLDVSRRNQNIKLTFLWVKILSSKGQTKVCGGLICS